MDRRLTQLQHVSKAPVLVIAHPHVEEEMDWVKPAHQAGAPT